MNLPNAINWIVPIHITCQSVSQAGSQSVRTHCYCYFFFQLSPLITYIYSIIVRLIQHPSSLNLTPLRTNLTQNFQLFSPFPSSLPHHAHTTSTYNYYLYPQTLPSLLPLQQQYFPSTSEGVSEWVRACVWWLPAGIRTCFPPSPPPPPPPLPVVTTCAPPQSLNWFRMSVAPL